MTEKQKALIHRIYGVVLSAALAVAGVLLMVGCVQIYRSGAKPFTPESVAATFSGIALPVYVCVGLIFLGFALDGFLPQEKKAPKVQRQPEVILQRLHRKLGGNVSQAILKEQRSRKLHRVITLGLLVAGSAAFLCYGANPANFHQSEITESMQKAMYVLLPCMAVPFGYGIFTAFYAKASMEREIVLAKESASQAPNCETREPAPAGEGRINAIRWAILCFGLVIALYGLFAGGTNDVLTKAINICTECVGLG